MLDDLPNQFIIVINLVFYRVLPIVGLSLITYGVWSSTEWIRGREIVHNTEVRAAALGFSFVGMTIGVLVGASKTPLGETALTGFLALVSAFSAYAYAKDSLDKYRPYAAPVLVTLSIALVAGTYYGATLRQTSSSLADLEKRLENSRMAVCRESAIKAAELGRDPISTMNEMCRLELGFFELPPAENFEQ